MAERPHFHTDTALADGLRKLLGQLEQRIELKAPVRVYLAGDIAAHLYTADRVTGDVDAEFSGRLFLPSDLVVEVPLEDGSSEFLHFDTNYTSTLALMHEEYLDDAIPVDMGVEQLHVYVLSPVDLAVSKIARLGDHDKEDIRALVQLGLTTADAIEQRATAALAGFVGGQRQLEHNIREAVALARKAEQDAVPPSADPGSPSP